MIIEETIAVLSLLVYLEARIAIKHYQRDNVLQARMKQHYPTAASPVVQST